MIIVMIIRESFNFEIIPQLIIDVIKFLFNFHSLTLLYLIISFIHPFNPTNLLILILILILLINLHPIGYHLALTNHYFLIVEQSIVTQELNCLDH